MLQPGRVVLRLPISCLPDHAVSSWKLCATSARRDISNDKASGTHSATPIWLWPKAALVEISRLLDPDLLLLEQRIGWSELEVAGLAEELERIVVHDLLDFRLRVPASAHFLDEIRDGQRIRRAPIAGRVNGYSFVAVHLDDVGGP